MNSFWKKITAICALAGILLPTAQAFAFVVPDVLTGVGTGIQQGENTTGIRLETVLAAAGLRNENYKECTSSLIFGALIDTIKNFDNIIQNALADFITQMFNTLKSRLIFCAFNGFLNHLVGAPIPCSASVVDQASATLRLMAKQQVQQNFVARCVARIALQDVIKTQFRILQEQGPYGSQGDWVTSWEAQPKQEQARAQARVYTLLVNTPICPYMRNQVLHDFGVPKSYIDNPPSMTGAVQVDASHPFTLRGACTLPTGFTPEDFKTHPEKYGGYEAGLALLQEPQNNPNGFEDMAQTELANQISVLTTAAAADAIAGGGYRSISDCISWSTDGKVCLAAGPNKQVGGSVRDHDAAIFQGQIDWLTNTDGTQKKAIDDIRTQIAARLFDMANQPLPLHIELGQEDNPNNFTPSPTPISSPGSGGPTDPACTEGDTRCTCVKNDTDTQAGVSQFLSTAIARAQKSHPSYFVDDTAKIAPGTTYRQVTQAICDEVNQAVQGQKVCEPSPSQDDQVIILGGTLTLSVTVITPDGYVRTNGGQAIRACEPGVQD